MHRTSTAIALALALIAPATTPVHAQNMMGGLPIDGIPCQAGEGAALHIHANLQIYNRGRNVIVPSNIGIPLIGHCLYWIHTHSTNGMIHIESPVNQLFTLGQFFDIWSVTLNSRQAASVVAPRGKSLRFTVNGRPWTKDPKLIPLHNHVTIVIQSGPPYAKPRKPDWGML